MTLCLICNNSIESFLSFGQMPIANGFLTPELFEKEIFYELKVGHCPHCQMVQLTELVDPSQLFHENYAYFSSISVHMSQHFKLFAEMVQQHYMPDPDAFVVEIGSNDGIMLQNFAQANRRHLGIEPSANVAKAAQEKGVQTVSRFFNEETAVSVRQEYGLADVILGANVVCHLPNIHSVLHGVQQLLKEKGVFIFEEPYLGDIIAQTAYDQIYDEHVFYFSLHSLSHLFNRYDMEIIDIAPQNVHGGSMRYVVARQGRHPVQPAVRTQWVREEEIGLGQPETYTAFCQRIYQSRQQLVDLLGDLKRLDQRIVGYGATSKSTTVINFCGLGPEEIDYISDTTPGKQGKYSPGVHIPVLPYERFVATYPDFALLFAWNHKQEIMAKEEIFRQRGGKFIVYVPSVQILA